MQSESNQNCNNKIGKICFLCPTMQGGGLERVVSELAMHFERVYTTQTVVFRDNGQRYPLPSPLIELSPNDISIPKLGIIKTLIESTIRYTIYLLKERPLLSLSFGGSTDWVNMASCFLSRTACVTSFHSNPSRNKSQEERSFLKKCLRRIVNKCYLSISDYTVATSEGIRETLLEEYNFSPEKIVTIYNPINTEDILIKKEEMLSDDFFKTSLPIILSVGWLYHIKGQWHLIRVFSEIQKIIPCKLVICGVGVPGGQDYTEKYHSLVSKLGLEEKVYFAGWQSNPYKYMKNSTIFVHPSLSESFSNVVAEALACECPVVASDCDFGPREILDGGKYGLLCTCSEWEYLETEPLTEAELDMLDKILLLLKDEKLREEFKKRGIERVKEFDTKKSMEQYGELFTRITVS